MSNSIEVQTARQYQVDTCKLSPAADIVLQQHQVHGALTIVLTDDDSVRSLNMRFRQSDTVTDVLSFPAAALPSVVADQHYLGDIIVAVDFTQNRANRNGTDLEDTLCLLVIHGTLHLLGYDHDSKETEKRMWEAQSAALYAMQIDPGLVAAYGGFDLDQAHPRPSQ